MSGEIAPKKIGRGFERNLDAGPLQPMVGSFELHLRAEKQSPKTIRTYLEAAQWFAAEYLIPAGLDTGPTSRRGTSRSGRLPSWAGTPTRTPTTSSGRYSSFSSGTPPKTRTSRARTRSSTSSRRRSETSSFLSSPRTS
jgi:hypothetical protein